MITWITETVAIGEYSDVTEELVKEEKITYIINLIEMTPTRKQKYLSGFPTPVCGLSWMPLIEDPGVDLRAFQRECRKIVKELFKRIIMGERVLIHCIAGMDRAPFIVALLLGLTVDLGYTQTSVIGAYRVIKKLRPQIIEHLEWLKGW